MARQKIGFKPDVPYHLTIGRPGDRFCSAIPESYEKVKHIAYTLMYYLLLAILYPLSLLPLRVLYVLSDTAYILLFRVAGYRKTVVADNLRHAFPGRDEAGINAIMREFYRSFCDQWIETLKLLSISRKELNKRMQGNWEVFQQLNREGKNTYALLGHQFNWEWGNVATQYNTPQRFAGIYLPLSGKTFDRLMLKIRARSGSMLVPASNMRMAMTQLKDKRYIMGFMADQVPGSLTVARWYSFMNRPAPFLTGAEKSARRSGSAVVFAAFEKIKRGHYRVVLEKICDDAAQTDPGFITRAYVTWLEEQLRRQPANWLWSHRRWKIKPEAETYINP